MLESEKSHADTSFGVYLEDYLPDGDGYYDHSYKWVDCRRHLGSMPRMTPKTLICSATLPRAISDKLDVNTMRICLKVDNPDDNFRKAEKRVNVDCYLGKDIAKTAEGAKRSSMIPDCQDNVLLTYCCRNA